MIVNVNVCGAEVSCPPLAVPPLSSAVTVTTASPVALVAGMKLRVPVGLMAGCTLKRALLSLVTVKVTLWPASLGGPGLTAVAQFANVCDPPFSFTVTSGPLVKDGG